MTFAFVTEHADEWPLKWMCEALEVSTSGYYAWLTRADSATQKWRDELLGAIEEIHAEVKHRYGSPRMHAELNARKYDCSPNTVAKIMKAHAIQARRRKRFVRTTDSKHALAVAENLLDRDFAPEGPNQSWCADITYIPTGEGFLYLAVVEDLFSRMVVGWSMDDSMESRLVVDAFEMALSGRCPEAGLLTHSDRGSQYASEHYQRVLAAAGIVCSMSGVGQCWDNAPVESFFGRMKCEIVSSEMFVSKEQAKAEIFEYLEVFYNRVRLHSALGYVSPVEFERTYNLKHR